MNRHSSQSKTFGDAPAAVDFAGPAHVDDIDAGVARSTTRGWRAAAGRWAGHGALAIVDQAFLSAANFFFVLMLARWLRPEEYGVFAVGNAVLMGLNAIHNSLMLEPLSVFGPRRQQDNPRNYRSAVLRINGVFALILALGVVLAGVALVAGGETGLAAYVGLAVAVPAVMSHLALRRLCYVALAPHAAVAGSVAYAVTLLAGQAALLTRGAVTAQQAFFVIAAAGIAASTCLLCFGRSQTGASASPIESGALIREHWYYGRWMLVASCAYWISSEAFYIITAAVRGVEATAAMRAVMNLVSPAVQAMAAISMVIVPALAAKPQPVETLRRFLGRVSAVATGGAIAYAVALLWLGPALMSAAYRGAYDGAAWLLPYASLIPILIAVSAGPQMLFRLARRPYVIAVAYAGAAAAAVVLGIPLVRWDGVRGALCGFVLCNAVYALILGWRARRLTVPG